MKTTLDIPSDLLEEAMRVSGAKTKRAAVLAALGDFARRGRMRSLAERLGDSSTFMTAAQLESLRVREMPENQTIKEVRAARQKISEQHGHDLVRLVDHYKKLQREKLESQARKEATARVAEAPEG